MNRTDDIDKVINALATSTRSPRGEYSARANFGEMQRRLAARRRRRMLMQVTQSAAAVILLAVLSWGAYTQMSRPEMHTVSTMAHTQTITLPDGSEVLLNTYSSISYPERFKSSTREVTVAGEAFFDVTRDEDHPFVVRAENVRIEVLGTQFNVDAYPNDVQIKTTLVSGSVAVGNDGLTNKLILTPNQSAIYVKQDGSLMHDTHADVNNELAWRRGELIFSNLPLDDIARELSNRFNQPVVVDDPALGRYRITARFADGESLDEVLGLLQTYQGFRLKHTNDTIHIHP